MTNRKRSSNKSKEKRAKVLFLDIESAPLVAWCWGLWENNVGLNQIQTDWYVLSWAAKWLGDPKSKLIYRDQKDAIDIEDDKDILTEMWKLLDEADVVIGHNLDKFDLKKLNTRFLIHGMEPPSSYRTEDTLKMARRKFSFTSNKLSYLTDKLCTKYKKLDHGKFSGFELWKQCMAGNESAWKEMKKYNEYDVLSLEELYLKLAPWSSKINFNVYSEESEETVCVCGSTNYMLNGYAYTSVGKYQRYRCRDCGKEVREGRNLLTKDKRKNIKRNI